MAILQKLNSKANLRKTSAGDLPYQTSYPVIAKYEADSTASQTIINMSFSVDQANKESFQLFIDGKLLREGASNDFIFTSIQADNTSSQLTLNSPIVANLNIIAIKLGVRVDSLSTGSAATGSGGSKNYFALNNANPDFEKNLTSPWLPCTLTWSGTAPSGTPTLTATNMSLSVSNSNPLAGSYSMLLTKAAANSQYQGFISDELTIDREDVAKVLYGSFSYELVSGTADFSGTSTQTYEIWIYNVNANQWVQPAGYRGMNQSNGVGQVTFSFQTDGTFANNSYRVAIITQQTGTGAIVVKFDDFVVGPQAIVLGAAMTDWVDRGTITIGATTTAPTKGTATTDKVRMRRIGDTSELNYEYLQTTAGTAGSGQYLISLPSGMSFDLTKITTLAAASDGTRNKATPIGSGVLGYAAGVGYNGNIVCYALNATQFTCIITSSQNGAGTGESSVDDPWGSGFYPLSDASFSFKAMLRAPIAGWGSFSQVSSDTDARVVAFNATVSNTSFGASSTTQLSFSPVNVDTHGAISGGNSYVIPVSGIYEISASGYVNTANSIAADRNVLIKIGGTTVIQSTVTSTFLSAHNPSIIRSLNAGQIITWEFVCGATAVNTVQLTVNCKRLSGPLVITATETVSAAFTTSATGTSSPTAPINFDSKLWDTHGSVTVGSNWKFSAPTSGTYSIAGRISSTTSAYVSIYKDGVAYAQVGYNNGALDGSSSPSYALKLNAGQTIDIRFASSAIWGGGGQTGNGTNTTIIITRVGN